MFKLACVLGIVFVTLALFKADAQTQRPPIADFLLKEPVSLMDWGMMRAHQSIDRAVELLNKEIDREVAADPRWRTMSQNEFMAQQNKEIKEYTKSHPDDPNLKSFRWTHYFYNMLKLRQFNYQYKFGYAEWSADQQRIRIGVAVMPWWREQPEVPRENLFTADRCTDLLYDVKAGLLFGGYRNEPTFLVASWFEHNGRAPSAIDQVLPITNIEVNISDFGGVEDAGPPPDLSCSQALNGGPATIHDHRQKQ